METSDHVLYSCTESTCLEELNIKDCHRLLASRALCAALMLRFFEKDFSQGRKKVGRSWDLENFDAGMVQLAMYSLCYLLCDSRHIPPTLRFSSRTGEVLGSDNPWSGRWPSSQHPKVWGKRIRTLRLALTTKGDSFSYKHLSASLWCLLWGWHLILVLVLVLCSVGFGHCSLDLDSPLGQLHWANPGLSLGPLAVINIGCCFFLFFFFNFPFWLVTLSIPLVHTLPFPSLAPGSGLLLFCHSP